MPQETDTKKSSGPETQKHRQEQRTKNKIDTRRSLFRRPLSFSFFFRNVPWTRLSCGVQQTAQQRKKTSKGKKTRLVGCFLLLMCGRGRDAWVACPSLSSGGQSFGSLQSRRPVTPPCHTVRGPDVTNIGYFSSRKMREVGVVC